MKKLTLLIALITTMSYGQIIDETGTTLLTGNIGIGVTPSTSGNYKLEVNGGGKFTNRFIVGTDQGVGLKYLYSPIVDYQDFSISGNNGNNRIRIHTNTAETELSLNNINGEKIYTLNTGDYGSDNVYLNLPKADSRIVISEAGNYLPEHKFVVKDGSAMIEGNILTNSNIGIGTSSFVDGADTYKLSVEGKVRAHAVKVYTSWADYVFEDSYNLPTLKEVEAYIQEHGHLKDIPSAEEVEESGIELGEMNKLLLQKIEELTLYTIQLKKEIDQLSSKKQ